MNVSDLKRPAPDDQDLRSLVRENLRQHRGILRKIRTLPLSVKAVLLTGNRAGIKMSLQWNRDIQLYGLYETLLYVADYEQRDQQSFEQGTTERAIVATLQFIQNPMKDLEASDY